ncbi:MULTISPECIES: ABC transporter permease [Pseudomonas]|uniref:ABC transporter permease n=1 Tax=Pseudomonas juntendi TaxID=2666183 RepID=A0A7W2QUF8_9PSED|nr:MULTISPECIES: ABC transporter permease [Pseudomonas]NOY02532.1 ABC transporter permease [Gammaproteobacteria bacterium]OAK59216.1 peptide ABC transporter permease [Pseudomonas putida]PPB17885.1 ABC transporter permease [Pseudomonas aeruginosa]MBA6143249.1 ABC transporter permease [Pseudomonas juntendi]MCL8330886.1 ABC transporter permease [Pseudomonas juntendi]
MGLLNTLRKQLFDILIVVIGVSIITFIISHLIPGDPARLIAGERASDEIVASIRQQLGLDLPLYQQYFQYMGDLLTGDLGQSIRTHRPVLEDLKLFFPATLELALMAMLISILVGVPLGILSAVFNNRLIDHISRTLAVAGISTPAFWLGLGLIVLFYGHLGILPGGGRLGEGVSPPPTLSGFYLLDSLVAGQWSTFLDAAKHMVLPAFTLAFVNLGVITRQIRGAMLEQLSEDYVRTARAYGLSNMTIIMRHVLPNALIPSITVIGLALGDLLYGAVLTETVFAWPGMGAYVVKSIQSLDFPAVMGFAILVSFIYVILNRIIELLYRLADPRIAKGD